MATKMSHGVPDLTRVCPYPLPRGIMSKRSPLETVTWCPRCDASVPGDGWRPSDPVDIWSLASPSVPAADVRPATLTKPDDGEAWIIFPEHFPSSSSFPWSPSVSKESEVHIWARWWKWWLLTHSEIRDCQCLSVRPAHLCQSPTKPASPCQILDPADAVLPPTTIFLNMVTLWCILFWYLYLWPAEMFW